MGFCGKQFEAVADVVAELGDGEAPEVGWAGLEAAEGVLQHAFRAEEVAAAEVFEGGGDLDDALQEGLFRLGGGEPNQFPGFVRGEVLAGVVAAEAFGEFALGPVEGHWEGYRVNRR